jgi:hypothetical protein
LHDNCLAKPCTAAVLCYSDADNAYAAEKGRYKLPRILSSMVRGIKCFDVAFFLSHNRWVVVQCFGFGIQGFQVSGRNL